MLFNHFGIIGWDEIEPVILSAIQADLPLLFIGDHGSCKTEGARLISKALLKANSAFHSYEVPTLNFDDLVGFLNPRDLGKGTLEFIATPLSIWQAEAILLDEIARANPFIQNKLMELIRTRKCMGLPTKLKLVFSATNPPQKYQSSYMDLALASRFVCVQVPSLNAMGEQEIQGILSADPKAGRNYGLKAILRKAKQYQLRPEDLAMAQQMCRKIVSELADREIVFNARQLKMMISLISNGLGLRYASGLPVFSNSDSNTAYITACIPELQGIVRSKVNGDMIRGIIRSIVRGFSLGDPILIAKDLQDLCEVDVKDSLAWVRAMETMAEKEKDPDVLRGAIGKIRKLAGKGVVERELARNLIEQFLMKMIGEILIREDAPVMGLDDRIGEITRTIKGEDHGRENIQGQ